jgi:antitoxin component of RelBE/YafQ-DinJ toxin-antitoxin module
MQIKKSISIDKDVWENAKKVIQSEAGMSMSKYIEITLRSLTRATTGTAQDYMQDTIMDFFKATDKKKKNPVVKVKKK